MNRYNDLKKFLPTVQEVEKLKLFSDALDNEQFGLNDDEKTELRKLIAGRIEKLENRKGTVSNVAPKSTWKKALGGGALALALLGGGYVLGANSATVDADTTENIKPKTTTVTTDMDKVYGEVDLDIQSFNPNINDALEYNLSNFRAKNIENGISLEDADSQNLTRFAAVMNMNEWDSRDMAAIDGLITTVEDLDSAFLNQAHVIANDYTTVTPDTIPDLARVISSNQERQPLEKRYELMAKFNTTTGKEKEEVAKELRELIHKTWTTDAYTKYNAQTMYLVSLFDDQARILTINAEDKLQLMTEDVFKIASEGRQIDNNECDNVCLVEIEDAQGKKEYRQVVSSTLRAEYRKDLRSRIEEVKEDEDKLEEGKLTVPEEEYETYYEIVADIDRLTNEIIEKMKYKFKENPSIDEARNKLDVSGAQIPSGLGGGTLETDPATGQTYVVDKVIGNPNGGGVVEEGPITYEPGISEDSNGNIIFEDDKGEDHIVTPNPGGGAFDPDIPIYNPNETDDILNQPPVIEDIPLEQDSNQTVETPEQTEEQNTNDGGHWENGYYIPDEDILTEEEKNEIQQQIEQELAEQNQNAPVTPIEQEATVEQTAPQEQATVSNQAEIEVLKQAKEELNALQAQQEQAVNEVVEETIEQGGMTR